MKIHFLLISFLLIPVFSFSQINPDITSVRNYSPDEYNASVQNWCAVQDHRGVMYFGNTYGVLEYDGHNWNLIPVSNNSIVRSLAVDRNGTIFVGAVKEFGYLSPNYRGELEYISLSQNLDTAEHKFIDVWKTYCYKDHVIFGSREYIFKYDYHSVTPYSDSYLKKGNRFLLKLNNDLFLNNLLEGLYLVKDSVTIAPDNDFFIHKHIMLMLPHDSEKALVGTYGSGIYVYDIYTGIDTIQYSFPNETLDFLKDNGLYDGIKLKDNYVFGTLDNGSIITDKNGDNIKYLNESSGLQSNVISSIYHSSKLNSEDPLWLTTINGISSVDIYSPFSFMNKDNGLESQIFDVIRYNSTIYVSTIRGVYYLEYDKYKRPQFKQIEGIEFPWYFFKYNPPSGKYESRADDEILLVSTTMGTFQITGKTAKSLDDKGMYTGENYCINASKKDTSILYLSFNKGIEIYQYNNKKWEKLRVFKFTAEIKKVIEDNSGILWLETNNSGVIKVYPDMTTEHLNLSHGLPTLNFIMLFELNNEIVFATPKGVLKFDNTIKKFKQHELFSKLYPDTNIGFLVVQEDKRGNIWVSRYKDYDYRIERIFENKLGQYEIDSLPFKRFNFKEPEVIYPEDNGFVWIGTGDGLFKYDRNIKKEYNKKYYTLLRKITLNRDSLLFGGSNFIIKDTIKVIKAGDININSGISVKDHEFKSIRFDFSAPFFEAEDKTEFCWYLEGYDENWSNWTKDTKVIFTGLPTGDFTFHVKAKNVYGIESVSASYKFKIYPPWYRSLWACIFYLIVFVWLVVKLYNRKLIKEKIKLEKIVTQRTSEINQKNEILQSQKEEILNQRDNLDDLNKLLALQKEKIAGQRDEIEKELKETLVKSETLKKESFKFQLKSIANQMNPHFMFNTLNAVKYFILQNDIETSDKYLGKFSKLMRLTLYNSLQNAVPIEDEIEALSLYLDLEKLRSREKFNYSIKIDEALDTKYHRIPSMLIQPFIENSLLHGIYNKKGKGEIKLELKKKKNIIHCIIEDNGIGITKAGELKKKKLKTHVSVGTSLIQQRLKLISELYKNNFYFKYSDIIDKNKKLTGTKVDIELPIIESLEDL